VRDWASTAPAAQTRSLSRRCRVPGESDDSKIAVQGFLCGPGIPTALDREFAQNDNYVPTVQFDRDLCGRTVEIQNVAIQRMLTAKFVACKVSVPQMTPKYTLRIGCFLSQQTSAIHEGLSYSPAQFRKVDQSPLTSVLSPQAGRGADRIPGAMPQA